MSSTSQAKAALRQFAKPRRLKHWQLLGEQGRRLAAATVLSTLTVILDAHKGKKSIAGFWPLKGEFELRPILFELSARGHQVCLPLTSGPGQPLEFRSWRPGDGLELGAFGVSVPGSSAPIVVPEIILVPLLAFDAAGYRLGYGGGFYDRTLSDLRAQDPTVLAIGIAYEMQQMERVPRNEFDQPLAGTLTEAGYFPADHANRVHQ